MPVPIHHVAERLNLTLEATALGDKVSGMLVVQGNEGSIGYNSAHARVRQRFTISHEIAHYLLHARRSGKAQLFIDKQITYRRDEQSSTGMDSDEIEANKLGAALLMPRDLVQQEVRAQDLDLDDKFIEAKLIRPSDLNGAIQGFAGCDFGHRTRDIIACHRLNECGRHPHFTALGRIVDDLLYEFEKLRGADDGVGTLRGFDQVLLREFCAGESAFEQTFSSYDG